MNTAIEKQLRDKPKTLVHALARNAREAADSTALVLPDDTPVSWRELWELANARAARLKAENIGLGAIVFVAGLQSLEFHVLLWASARVGAVFAPLNLQFTATEIRQYIEPLAELHRCALVSDPAFREKFSLLPGDLPRFALQETDADHTWRAMVDAGSAFAGELPEPGDGLYLISTSGSTGFPKPALLPHRAALSQAMGTVARRDWQRDERFLAMSPMFHISGLAPIGSTALAGSTLYVMTGFDPATALRRIERDQITMLAAFDVLLDKLMSLPEFEVRKMKSIRHIMFAGSPKYYQVLRSWGIGDIAGAYALTEATAVALLPHDCTDEHLRQWSNGVVLPGVDVRIVDPESRKVLPEGNSGEICVRGNGLFLGYLGREEATAASFDSDGFFHTGDRGRLESGYLFYEGRYKAMIKTGGENVSELEVENFLGAEIPEIRQVAVVGAPDATWGEVVCACIEFMPGQELSLDTIRARSREKLAGFKLPRRLLVVQANTWPQLATGKLDKGVLRERVKSEDAVG